MSRGGLSVSREGFGLERGGVECVERGIQYSKIIIYFLCLSSDEYCLILHGFCGCEAPYLYVCLGCRGGRE